MKKIQNVKSNKIISVFTLIMINLVAVDSLRSLPATAQYGYSIIFYYLVAGVLFFIPTALVAGELASTYPVTGGIYFWAKEAFGKKIAFSLVCLQWVYNICWYPTILSLIAATGAYCINPELANNKIYMFLSVSSIFWIIVFINLFGLKISNYMSTVCSIFGIIVPMCFIIVLGFVWLLSGMPSQITFTSSKLLPNLTDIRSLVFFTSVLFSLVGIEMSAVHAQDVKNPQRDYPRAIFVSTALILASLALASLAIAIVVPVAKLNLVTGLLEAYRLFLLNFHIQWLMPIVAVLIIFGGVGGVSAWLLGPVKALLIASEDGLIPKSLGKINSFGAPYKLIILQGIIFMILLSAFIFMPSISSGFWFLSVITSQLALIFYIGLFCTAIVLRYKFPDIKRPFSIPFGKFGVWVTCVSGILVCIFTIWVGFFPPSDINISWSIYFKYFLFVGILVSCILPYLWANFFVKE